MGVIAIEVKTDLCANDFGDAPRVAVFFFLKVNIALPEVAFAVEHEELYLFAEAAVEASLKLWDLFFGVGLRILGKVVAALVEIHIEVVVHIVRPMEVAILHAVLAERHVHAVVELGMRHRSQGKEQGK